MSTTTLIWLTALPSLAVGLLTGYHARGKYGRASLWLAKYKKGHDE